jgi:phage tail sheath protein FI
LARGRLTKPVDVEVALNQGDRDSLYSGGNIINPITKFAQDGIVIFGQRTALRSNKATNRINIRRLLIEIRDTVVNSTRQFAFEPNDRFTWDRIETVVAPILDSIKRERGITEFKVICDETTNTAVRVDRNELWCKVLLKPTKTAEVVVFEINVTNQSAQIGN